MKYGSTLLLAIALAAVSCTRERAVNTAPESTAVSGSPAPAAPAKAESQPHWNYDDKGPSQWGTLSNEWAICGNGKEQSPVDIEKASTAKLPSISTDFEPAELKI